MQRKLTEDQVVEMRKAYVDGASVSALAKRFAVHPATVSAACRGVTYKTVPNPVQMRRQGSGPKALSDEIVTEVRRTYAAGEVSIRQFAKRYGCSRQAISAAIRGHTYKHLPGALARKED